MHFMECHKHGLDKNNFNHAVVFIEKQTLMQCLDVSFVQHVSFNTCFDASFYNVIKITLFSLFAILQSLLKKIYQKKVIFEPAISTFIKNTFIGSYTNTSCYESIFSNKWNSFYGCNRFSKICIPGINKSLKYFRL